LSRGIIPLSAAAFWAGVESKEFSQISKAELDVAIEFTREILKALYQYAGLLQKLRSLKATP